MKKRAILYELSGLLVSVAVMLTVAGGHVAAAGFTCTWTGGGSDTKFSTSGNWSSCNSAAPTAGDNLVFNETATNVTPNNDMTGLSVGSVSFTGAISTTGYDITGNALTITGGITDNSTGNSANTFDIPVTFNGTQTITGTHVPGGGNPLAFNQAVTFSSGTVTVSISGVTFGGALSGSGSLTLGGTSAVSLGAAASNFTGAISLGAGTNLSADVDGALGGASVTIGSGAALYITSSQTNLTMANAITMAGTGLSNQGALNITLASTGTLTLSGAVTLTGDTTIQPNGSAVKVTGTYTSNGHVLSASTGSVTVPSAAKAPSTGLAAVKSSPLIVFGVTTAAAVLLAGFALKARKPATRH